MSNEISVTVNTEHKDRLFRYRSQSENAKCELWQE